MIYQGVKLQIFKKMYVFFCKNNYFCNLISVRHIDCSGAKWGPELAKAFTFGE